MPPHPTLAILDWGIGGLGLYRLIKAANPGIPVLYLSDTGTVPYGRMSRDALVARLNIVTAALRARGATRIVFGCNAASTAIPLLVPTDVVITGVIESAIRQTARLRPARLALIGGRRTVRSGVYRRAFGERGILVTQRIAQPLSGMIEAGDTNSPALRSACAAILAPVAGCTHLLLACTHYPAIASVIRESLASNAVLVNPSEELAREIARWDFPRSGRDQFLTSGDPCMMRLAARNAFDVELPDVQRVVVR